MFLLFGCHLLSDGGLIQKLEETTKIFGETGKKIFETGLNEKQDRLAALEEEKSALELAAGAFDKQIDAKVVNVEQQLVSVKAGLKNDSDDEFLTQKQEIFNEWYQVLKDTKKAREDLIERVEEGIKLYSEYLRDPSLDAFRKEQKLDMLPPYSFEYAQMINKKITDQEKATALLAEQEKNAVVELENRKRIVSTTVEVHSKKQKELEKLGKDDAKTELFGLDLPKKAELLRAEEGLYKDKIELENIRLRSIEYKISFSRVRLFIAKMKGDLLRDTWRRIKSFIQVSEADVSFARDELAKKKQKLFEKKEAFSNEIEKLTNRQKTKERELEDLSKRYSVPLGEDLDDFSREIKPRFNSYLAFFEVGNVDEQLLLIQREKDFLEAQIALEAEKLNYESVQIDIKDSFYKIATRVISSDEDRAKEAKKYDALRAEANASISLFKEKRNSATGLLDTQKKVVENNKKWLEDIQQKRTLIFKGHDREYVRVIQLLQNIERIAKKQIEILGKISNIYTDSIDTISVTIQQINFVVGEFITVTIWERPEHAISWEGLRAVSSNLDLFVRNVYSYIIHFNVGLFVQKIRAAFVRPFDFLFFFIKMMVLLIVLIVLWKYVPVIVSFLLHVNDTYRGLRASSFFFAALCGFFIVYFVSIAIWLIIFIGMHLYPIPDPYLYIVLYLLSIPYLMYLANRFVSYLVIFNKQQGYIFLSREYQRRFVVVFSTLLYATIGILFFREAFLLANYARSELPTILLALNFIIFQISLIFLIDKEQILSLIPTKNELWQWIRDQVDNYYYLILVFFITIIVLSNPYVGFGQLVLFILLRLVYTIILIRALFWIQMLVKRASSSIFFSTRDEVVRERFTYSRTWYGVFVIIFFFLLLFIGLIIGARIWGWPEALTKITRIEDVALWLKKPILGVDTENPISIYLIMHILFFISAGFILSLAVNKFVLGRVFDVLPVEPGVQDTVTSLARYLIIIIAVIFGFQSVGLSALVYALLGALILGVGWVIKDPISDFIAYFIILVQRPLKIGDYVKIDEETIGVVRKITPRAVVLRRKNSITIIIPNSIIINKSVMNWNYTLGFIAFDDIFVSVPYKHDPSQVKTLLLETLEESPYVLKSPKPIVRLDNFGEYGYNFMVRGYISSNYTLEQWNIASAIRLAIVKKFDAHNISIAVPIRILRSNNAQEYMDIEHKKK